MPDFVALMRYTDPTDPLTREAVGRIGSALWPDAPDAAPDAAEPQLGMQLGPATSARDTEGTQGQYGCAARDSNPEPAD